MKPRGLATVILLLGFAATLALNWPGQMSPDSVNQLYQGRTGIYDSWHPPVMAWLLGLFDRLLRGTGLFILFDASLLTGAWLLLLGLGRRPGWASVAVAALLVLTPQWLLYQGTVWKDILFADAAIAAFAALALAAANWNAQAGRWLLLFLLLLTLAAMTRQNGLLLIPVGALTLGVIAQRRERRGFLYGGGAFILLLLLSAGGMTALSWRGDHGAGAQRQLRVAQSYDLIGALRAAPGLELPVLERGDPGLAALMRGDGSRLYSPLFNDTLAESERLSAAIQAAPDGVIFSQWLTLVTHHPALYVRMRWPVFRWVAAAPDVSRCHPAFAGVEGPREDMQALGLTPQVRRQDRALAAYTRAFMGTPILSHPAFLLLALIVLACLIWRGTASDLAIAGLLVAALLFAASFFVISIACDYRYLYFLDLSALTATFYLAGTAGDAVRG